MATREKLSLPADPGLADRLPRRFGEIRSQLSLLLVLDRTPAESAAWNSLTGMQPNQFRVAPQNSPSETTLNPLGFMAKATPQLQAAISARQSDMAPAEFGELLSNIRSLFTKYTAKLLEFPAGRERGTALHQLMEQELKAAGQLASSCHRGCAGCCRYEVEITRDEAMILSQAVQQGVAIDHRRLGLQAARERQSPEWRNFFHPDNRCVFLGPENECVVYADRPAICRKHRVVSPAVNCTTAGAEVAPIRVLLAEILLSASLSLEGNTFGSLPKMLVAALRPEDSAVSAVTTFPQFHPRAAARGSFRTQDSRAVA